MPKQKEIVKIKGAIGDMAFYKTMDGCLRIKSIITLMILVLPVGIICYFRIGDCVL